MHGTGIGADGRVLDRDASHASNASLAEFARMRDDSVDGNPRAPVKAGPSVHTDPDIGQQLEAMEAQLGAVAPQAASSASVVVTVAMRGNVLSKTASAYASGRPATASRGTTTW